VFSSGKTIGFSRYGLRPDAGWFMPDLPLIILTSTGIDSFKAAVSQRILDSLLREEVEGKGRLYTAWADSFRYGQNRLIEDVGHVTLPFRRPDALLQAIQDVIDGLHRRSSEIGLRTPYAAHQYCRSMIARIWRGAVRREDVGEYADYINRTGMAEYRSTPGNQGAWMLRRDDGDRSEIITFSLWDSRDSIQAFAGEDIEQAVFYPEDDRFLIERDLTVRHYEVVA
jgi:heme-degrading monooxygenase HmoA